MKNRPTAKLPQAEKSVVAKPVSVRTEVTLKADTRNAVPSGMWL